MKLTDLARRHWPAMAAAFVVCAGVFFFFTGIVEENQGHFTYVIDEPYIHMSIAKNLAMHGVWGITRYGFSSSSSSITWPLLLALCYLIFGVNEISPLLLNLLFGILAVAIAYFILLRYRLTSFFMFGTLLAMLFSTSVIGLVFTGMEHLLHISITLCFLYLTAVLVSREEMEGRSRFVLLLLASLLTATRYEGVFLVATGSFLFFARRRFSYSLLLTMAGVLPLAVYGAISLSNGSFFLPNPIAIKSGGMPEISVEGAYRVANHFIENFDMIVFFVFLACIIFFVLEVLEKKTIWREEAVIMLCFISMTLPHLGFAKTGWFFRYEAYLIACGILAMAIALKSRSSAWVMVMVFIVPMLFARGVVIGESIAEASANQYDKQYQTALFIKEFYEGHTVVVNDIGMVNYLTDFRCVDLWGLSDVDVTKLIVEGRYNTKNIDTIVEERKAKIAIVYDFLLDDYGGVPGEWDNVGGWRISNSVWFIANNGKTEKRAETISFYAIEKSEKEVLIRNLREFSPKLPEDVTPVGEYATNT